MKNRKIGRAEILAALCVASFMLTAPASASAATTTMNWKNPGGTSYATSDVVLSDGTLYICTKSLGCAAPGTTGWVTITDSVYWMGAWSSDTDYKIGCVVQYNGASYLCIKNATAGTLPTNTTYWVAFAAKGDTGAVGPQGPQGEKGDTGAVGPQGPAGPGLGDLTFTCGKGKSIYGFSHGTPLCR